VTIFRKKARDKGGDPMGVSEQKKKEAGNLLGDGSRQGRGWER